MGIRDDPLICFFFFFLQRPFLHQKSACQNKLIVFISTFKNKTIGHDLTGHLRERPTINQQTQFITRHANRFIRDDSLKKYKIKWNKRFRNPRFIFYNNKKKRKKTFRNSQMETNKRSKITVCVHMH